MNLIKKKDFYIYKSLLLKQLKSITSFMSNVLKNLKAVKQNEPSFLKNGIINKSLVIIINIKYMLITGVNESISSFYTDITRV